MTKTRLNLQLFTNSPQKKYYGYAGNSNQQVEAMRKSGITPTSAPNIGNQRSYYGSYAGNTNQQIDAMKKSGVTPMNNGQKTAPSISYNAFADGITQAGRWGIDAYKAASTRGGIGRTIGGIGPFRASEAYNQAMAYTNSLLEQMNSGRTAYSDKVDELMAKINGRDKFSYDMDRDPLFQQYLNSSMAKGKIAMQDTIGQASALTGGYGSTYATSAANGAYNDFVSQAYDNVADYYNMALNAYNQEGQDLYNQLGMYQNADATAYDRLANAYNANFANAQNIYNQEYSNYWDTANYNMNAKELQYKYDALAQDQKQYEAKMLYDAMTSQTKSGSSNSDNPSGTKSVTYTAQQKQTHKDKAKAAFDEGGMVALKQYMDSMDNNTSDADASEIYSYAIGDWTSVADPSRNWKKARDAVNLFGGVNWMDAIKDSNGNVLTIRQYVDELKREGYSQEEAEEMAKKFNKDKLWFLG